MKNIEDQYLDLLRQHGVMGAQTLDASIFADEQEYKVLLSAFKIYAKEVQSKNHNKEQIQVMVNKFQSITREKLQNGQSVSDSLVNKDSKPLATNEQNTVKELASALEGEQNNQLTKKQVLQPSSSSVQEDEIVATRTPISKSNAVIEICFYATLLIVFSIAIISIANVLAYLVIVLLFALLIWYSYGDLQLIKASKNYEEIAIAIRGDTLFTFNNGKQEIKLSEITGVSGSEKMWNLIAVWLHTSNGTVKIKTANAVYKVEGVQNVIGAVQRLRLIAKQNKQNNKY